MATTYIVSINILNIALLINKKTITSKILSSQILFGLVSTDTVCVDVQTSPFHCQSCRFLGSAREDLTVLWYTSRFVRLIKQLRSWTTRFGSLQSPNSDTLEQHSCVRHAGSALPGWGEVFDYTPVCVHVCRVCLRQENNFWVYITVSSNEIQLRLLSCTQTYIYSFVWVCIMDIHIHCILLPVCWSKQA